MKKTKFEPMLAARKLERPDELRYPLLVSIKLDGYRATVYENRAVSRKLKPIKNVFTDRYLSKPRFNGLDGELTVGPPNAPDLIQRMGAIRRINGQPDFMFRVFDSHAFAGSFIERYQKLRDYLRGLGDPRIVLIEHQLVKDADQLKVAEEIALDKGYEGLILRDPKGPYKFGRSSELEGWMMKLKRWTDDEMEITGFEEEFENQNKAEVNELGRTKRSKKKGGLVGKGRLGAFLGKDIKTGVEVRVGSGLTAVQRSMYWDMKKQLLGEIVTYKHFDQTGVHEKRRFTIFRAFRDRDDL
jgi:DNA ligase-1